MIGGCSEGTLPRPGGNHGSVRSLSRNDKCWTIDQQKRNLGITTAVVAIIAIAATADTVPGIALSQTVQSAETVNQLAESAILILTLNQQVALVQEQVDYIWTFRTANMFFYHVMCITPGTILHASATVMKVNLHERGLEYCFC